MELKDVASVSGKPGLFKVLKPTRTGVILEALNESRSKFIAGATHRVSLLKEISIYTTDRDGSVPLEEVFHKINEEHGEKLPVNTKSDNGELYDFIGSVVPAYDQERVYTSDIKKLVTWYEILSDHAPEVLKAPKEEAKKEEEKPEKKEASEAKASKKTTKKSAEKK